MRIEQLQAFLAVAETGNFGQAARQCGVTQSTISRQIQSLEIDLGLPLFHRTAQAKLTIAGEKLLSRAKKICTEWTIIHKEIEDLHLGKQPELCVAGIHSVCSHYLPPVLQHFCRDYPEVQLRVTALGSDRALKVLRDGLVDVAIVMHNRFLTASPEMVVEVLYEEQIEVLMAANHPLNQYSEVLWSDLVNYPQVVFKDGYGMQRLVQEWFSRQDAPLKMAMELNTLDAFRGVVRQGNMVALLPQSALFDAYQDETLAVRPIAFPPEFNANAATNGKLKLRPTRQVVMVTTSDRLQIPPIAHFCELVRQGRFQPFPSLFAETSKLLATELISKNDRS
ncbi:LysR family transcriptional regulator [Chroococcus sp. FPU101]|uniref:LysR family transcriptional regulator n=1 Tax=Chroococcus sp. FPU101 TaxID=1974212 RepID=UPI001A8F43B9|nr:LysR family transcriptional regulator [Chroococcus sp. FPU101]GFE68740.1 transcriptional regulator [Chroococcus sp. FPU101]